MVKQPSNDSSAVAFKGRAPRVGVIGATLGTGNLGVDALGAATVQGLLEVHPKTEICYQAWSNEPVDIRYGDCVYRCEPLVISRHGNLRKQNGVMQLRRIAEMRARFGSRIAGGLASFSTSWRRLRSCDAILDLSAGDSFADIYGDEVFWYQSQIKLMCIDLGLPLVLMPQTLGPFRSQASKAVAADILSRCRLVCTREAEGIDEVRRLCADRRLPPLVEAPDVAFQLQPSTTPLPHRTQQHLKGARGPVIAVNVSGLLYFSRRSFGLVADQAELMLRLVRWALSHRGSRVLLVPHVVNLADSSSRFALNSPTSDSSDTRACQHLLGRLTETERAQVDLLKGAADPACAKYALSKCDFFVGARMHAFIGAASQGVPGALLAYSKKAEGTTNLLGINDLVVDLRSNDADTVVAAVHNIYLDRQRHRDQLSRLMPQVKDRITSFFHHDLAQAITPPKQFFDGQASAQNAQPVSLV